MSDTLTLLLQQVLQVVPRVVSAILVFIIGYIIVKILSKSITRLLAKIKLDQLGDKLNDIEIIAKANLRIKLSVIVGKIVHYFLMLFVILVATDILQLAAISTLVVDLFTFVPRLLVALVLLVIGILVSEMIRKMIETALRSLVIPSATLIANFVFYFLFVNVIIVAVSQAGISTDFLEQNISIIIGGAVLAFSIGYGLASRDIMANFLTSFYVKDKISIGDAITFEGETGQVIDIDKNSIKILSGDKYIYFPMKALLKDKIIIHNKQLKLK